MNLKKILFSKEFLKFCSFEYGSSSVDLLKYSRVDLFSILIKWRAHGLLYFKNLEQYNEVSTLINRGFIYFCDMLNVIHFYDLNEV